MKKTIAILMLLIVIIPCCVTNSYANENELHFETLDRSEDLADIEEMYDDIMGEVSWVGEEETNSPVKVDNIDFSNSIKIYKYAKRIYTSDASKIIKRLDSSSYGWVLYVEEVDNLYQVGITRENGAWEISSIGVVDSNTSYVAKLRQHRDELKKYDSLICVSGLKEINYPAILCISDNKLQDIFLFQTKSIYPVSQQLEKNDNTHYIDADELMAIYKKEFWKKNVCALIAVVFLFVILAVAAKKFNTK